MAEVKPFRAMRYDIKIAGELSSLVCPPYDIIPPEEQARLYAGNPFNAINLELAPGEGALRYKNAAASLCAWLKSGALGIEQDEALYIYEEEFEVAGERKTLRGVIARVGLEEFDRGVVLPHEETLSKAKEDRFNLMVATNCNLSQVYSMYIDDGREITPKIDDCANRAPDAEFAYSDGVTHRLWIERDAARLAAITAAFKNKQLFIADGHHRYETALAYRDRKRTEGKSTGAQSVMMMLVDIDHPGLVVLPTHRVVYGLENYDSAAALRIISKNFDVVKTDDADALRALSAARGTSFIYRTADGSYFLTFKNPDAMTKAAPYRSGAYRELDVAVLHSLILEPCFGIDRDNMARGVNLRYTRDADEARGEVISGAAQAAFIINPTKVRQIKDVALAGDKMPQKSTYFYPKIITGLIYNNLEY